MQHPTLAAFHVMKPFSVQLDVSMIFVDESEPIGELKPSFQYRDVIIRQNEDVNYFYNIMEELGRGKFGIVRKCTEKTSGKEFAAKYVPTLGKQSRNNVIREVEIMNCLHHPLILQLYDAFDNGPKEICLILELIEGGELFERVIDDDFILTEKACAMFAFQMCDAMAFMHGKNIIHLDMKPENVLCLTLEGNRIKLIDFGMARKYDPEKTLKILFGTPEFAAPEVVNFEQINCETDMWSVGVICYVLLSGLSPFVGDSDAVTMANVTIAKYDFNDEAFENVSDEAKDFISKLLVKDKMKRMKARDSLKHSWICVARDRELTKSKLKRYVIRRRWQKAVNAILALRRMGCSWSS